MRESKVMECARTGMRKDRPCATKIISNSNSILKQKKQYFITAFYERTSTDTGRWAPRVCCRPPPQVV